MKRTISFLLIFIVAFSSFAQNGWHWQNPKPQGNPLYGINFLRDYGWAVGTEGTAIHTSDGGLTWQVVDLGIKENINSVYMHDDLMAFMVGDNGLIKLVIERENGFEITHYPHSTSEDLNSVTSYVSDTTDGCPWAVGEKGTILRSNDFWQSWDDQSIPFNNTFYSIDNIGCTEAWVSGSDGMIVYTGNGGDSWSYRSVPTSWDLLSVHVGSFDNIRVVGQQSTIWQSANKGVTWEQEHEEPGYNLNDVINIDENVAYAAGDQGKIFETTNNGDLWQLRNTGTTATLYDVEDQWAHDQVWVSGHYGVILKNSGAGTDFELMTEGYLDFLHDVEFVNDSIGWAVGGSSVDLGGNSTGIILHTTNSGESWEEQLNLSSQLSSVDFISATEGWAVGRDGTIRHTANGGNSWSTQPSPISGYLTGVCFVDKNNGWVVSRDNWGQIIHSSNGGATWTEQENPASNPLHGLFFINALKGWAVGLDSTIIRTVDGGLNWERCILNLPNNFGFFSVFFTNELHGCAVGHQGCILITENGGVTWQRINTGFYDFLNSVYFIDHNNGWASGDQGTILRTVNGGKTWFRQRSGVSTNYIASVHFTNPSNGWAVGEGGTIIQTKSGGFSHDQGTFWVEGLELPIIEDEETKSSIEVNVDELIRNGYILTGLEIMIDTILHPRASDLEIYLTHDGSSATLVNHVSDEGENFLWTKFTDAATTIITDGIAPFSGDYKPVQLLEVFNGMNPNGTWTLTIIDNVAGQSGTLQAWGLKPVFERVLSIDEQGIGKPDKKIQLFQNVPNPFTGTTTISWLSQISGQTILKVFNLNGQEIATLINKNLAPGRHSVEFEGSHLGKGVYYYQLKVGNEMLTRKCVVI